MISILKGKRRPYFYETLFLVSGLIIGVSYFTSITLGLVKPLTPLTLPLSLLIVTVSTFALLARKRLGDNYIVLGWSTDGLFWSLISIDSFPRNNEHLRFLLNPYCAVAFTVLLTAWMTYFGIMKKRGWI